MNFFKNLWGKTCNFFKKIWQKINHPHGWKLALFYVAFVAVIASTLTLVCLGYSNNIFSYVLYGLSAILLTYFVYTIVYFAPRIKNSIIYFLQSHKFTSALLDDYGFRTLVFSIFTFIINVAYIAFMIVFTVLSRSAWYFSLTIYYAILAIMKGNIFHSKRKYNTPVKQARAFRYCGILFIVMTIVFSGIIVLIYKSNRYFEYAGLMIFVVAAFTFYKLTFAIINIFKARKQDNLYIQSIRNINLASSLISIIVLQVAMFQAFSPESNGSFANALTGAVISLIILALGIYMIVKANKTIKELNSANENEEWFWI